VPGFHDRKVVLSMDSTGKTVSLPLRFNDSDAEWERARDLEFEQAVCHRLGRALSSLATSGIKVALTKEATAHPVLKASEVGFQLREVSHPATDKRFAREV
jgi:putative NIF3 family GTP cyclohydrolase 1 type 2